MTKPRASVPPPRQFFFDEGSTAMYELENRILHPAVAERFHDRHMDLDLIQSIIGFLKVFNGSYEHELFVRLANNPEADDTDHYKIRNLIALTPLEVYSAETSFNDRLGNALTIMNGLSVWSIRTDNALVVGDMAVQARALMSVTALTQYSLGVEIISHWVSDPLRHSNFLDDPELAQLVKEYPQHHEMIADAILTRESCDAELIRAALTEGSLVINEGML
jgi:hypothetical protein